MKEIPWNPRLVGNLIKLALLIIVILLIIIDSELREDFMFNSWRSFPWQHILYVISFGIILFLVLGYGFQVTFSESDLMYFFETQEFYTRGKGFYANIKFFFYYMISVAFLQEFIFRFLLVFWGLPWIYANLIFAASHLVSIFLYKDDMRIPLFYTISALFLGYWLTYIYLIMGLIMAIICHGIFVLIVYYYLEKKNN